MRSAFSCWELFKIKNFWYFSEIFLSPLIAFISWMDVWNIVVVSKSLLTLCNLTDCSTQGFLVLLCLLEFAQTHVPWVSDVIQPSHSLLPSSPPALWKFDCMADLVYIHSELPDNLGKSFPCTLAFINQGPRSYCQQLLLNCSYHPVEHSDTFRQC